MPLFGKDEEKEGWVSRFIDEIKSFFKLGFQAVWDDLINIIPKIITRAMSSIDGWTWGNPKEEELKLLDDLLEMGAIDKRDYFQFRKWIDSIKHGRNFAYWTITLSLLMQVTKTHSAMMMGSATQEWNKEYAPAPPSPNDILRAGFIAPEKINEVIDAMRRTGLDEKDIDLMFLANYAVYPMEIVRTAWLRGELTDDKMYERMRELGFTDTRTKEIVATWPVIPGVQDILYMVAKEAFEPDIIEHIGLADEFPGEQSQWMEKQGLSDFWTKKYWYAHWDTPSVGQVYEMLHRGVINDN